MNHHRTLYHRSYPAFVPPQVQESRQSAERPKLELESLQQKKEIELQREKERNRLEEEKLRLQHEQEQRKQLIEQEERELIMQTEARLACGGTVRESCKSHKC